MVKKYFIKLIKKTYKLFLAEKIKSKLPQLQLKMLMVMVSWESSELVTWWE